MIDLCTLWREPRGLFVIGDVFDRLKEIPDDSVDLVFTSPPFLNLRSYLPADDPLKNKEIGGEPTPEAFIDTMLDVLEEVGRVLAPHGSACFEFGDTFCADTETEILSRSGWKAWNQLSAGNEVLTINPTTRLAEWQPVEAVNVFPAALRQLLSLEGRSLSALITANHRWLVLQRRGGSGRRWYDWEIRTSAELTSDSSVPTAAPVANLPIEAKYSDALVEAVAWYWTEGHDRKPGKGRTQESGIYIAQSHRVNPGNVVRIRACLTALFGSPLDRLPGVKNARPAWCSYLYRSDPHKTDFRLNAAAARVLREHAPGRVPKVEWLASLTQAQLDLFIERSIDADGQRTVRGVGLAQKSYERASMFQAACLLAGRSASLNERHGGPYPMWAVTINTSTQRRPLRQASVQWIEHDGPVWCPTTANGTWLARRRGTTYFTGNSGSGGAGGDYNEGGLREGQLKWSGSAAKRARVGMGDEYRPSRSGRDKSDWPDDKSLCLIPESFRWACSYGRNPFNGRVTPRWKVRNVVRWWRPNPPVGDLGDKFRPATSDIAVLTKSKTRYFDQDAVKVVKQTVRYAERVEGFEPGAPLQDTWIVPTKSYTGSHYAVFPTELVTPFVLSMCPQRVCIFCGEPSRRIVEKTPEYEAFLNGKVNERAANPQTETTVLEPVGERKNRIAGTRRDAEYITVGWTECDCPNRDKWRPGIVLDPFVGSGTTLAVATGCGRSAVGVDLDRRNIDLARERVGLFLIEEE